MKAFEHVSVIHSNPQRDISIAKIDVAFSFEQTGSPLNRFFHLFRKTKKALRAQVEKEKSMLRSFSA
jgi:hypothetical protein